MRRVVGIAAALAFAACSQSTSVQRAGGGKGELHVAVHEQGEAQVQEVHIALVPDPNAPNPAPAPVDIVLLPGAPGVGRTEGPPVVWTWTERGLEPGGYLVQAKAYEVSSPGPAVDPLFESSVVSVNVQIGQAPLVSLFLHQHLEEDPFDNPYIAAISFDAQPAEQEISRITVRGGGGIGALSLEASGPGKLGKREEGTEPAAWNGKGWGDARDPDGAKIDWEPDASGPVSLTLTLVDQEGNQSTVAVVVNVDEAEGDIDFQLVFNHAPWSKLNAESLVNGMGMSVEVTARYGDVEPDTDLVDYSWDVSDCLAEGFAVEPVPVGGLVEGSLVADQTASHTVTFSAAPAPLPDPPPSCVATLEVRDRGLPGDATAVSSSTRLVRITLGTVHPCVGELTACGTECVDLETDNDHCGACNNACGPDQTCTAGACLCDDPGLTACGTECVDMQNDDNHCGGCGNACSIDEACEAGVCDVLVPEPGEYEYTTKVASGITDPRAGAWHPSGEYALVAAYSGPVFKYTPDGQLQQVTNQSGVYWTAITFTQDGSKAILVGYHNTNYQGRVFIWDHETQTVSQDTSATINQRGYQDLAWSPDGELFVLATSAGSGSSIISYIQRYDLELGMGQPSALNTGGNACTSMAWATNVIGEPRLALACNSSLREWTVDEGWSPNVTSTGNLGNVSGRPQKDYALAVSWSSSFNNLHRYINGAWATGVRSLAYPRRVSFSTSGKRALIFREKLSGTSNPGIVWEYLHDDAGVGTIKSVDIPSANFNAIGDQVFLNKALWKPGCDEGIVLAGRFTSPLQGYIIEFKVTNGKACPTP